MCMVLAELLVEVGRRSNFSIRSSYIHPLSCLGNADGRAQVLLRREKLLQRRFYPDLMRVGTPPLPPPR